MISIIVPIYKVEKYIRQCVDSIINQTYEDIEIILVDDGSPDNCPQICDDYAKTDSRVKVIHKENGGIMSARKAGVKVATGEYIGFVDGDDWIEADMYECFANAIHQYHPDMAICEFYFSYPEEEGRSSQKLSKAFFLKEDMKRELYPTMLFKDKFYSFGINPCCWSKVFKKEILEHNLNKVTTKIRIGEDAAFVYPCLLEAENIAYVDKFLYHYRINRESITKAYDINMEDTILLPYDILSKALDKDKYNFSSQLNYYLLYLVNMVIRNEANRDNKKSASQRICTFKKFTDNENVVNAAKSVEYSRLPKHTQLIAKFISLKSPVLLYFYSVLLRRFL